MNYDEEPDFEDPSARAWRLHALKLQAKFDAYRQGVAKTFDVSLPTVDRWVTGENPPHPAMVKGVKTKEDALDLLERIQQGVMRGDPVSVVTIELFLEKSGRR